MNKRLSCVFIDRKVILEENIKKLFAQMSKWWTLFLPLSVFISFLYLPNGVNLSS